MRFLPWVILSFFVVGIANRLFQSPMSVLAPLIVAGAAYYLYRYPPGWLIQLSGSSPSRPTTKKKKKNPFKVISGKK